MPGARWEGHDDREEGSRLREREPPGLQTPLTEIVGGRTATALAKASLVTVGDLLRHYPRRYSERGKLTDLAQLRVGDRATVWVRIDRVETRRLPPQGRNRRLRSITTVHVTDGHRRVTCTFFNQPWMADKLLPGMEAMFSGKVSSFRGSVQFSAPDVAIDRQISGAGGLLEELETFAGGLIPVYPLGEGLTAALLQRSIRQVLAVVKDIPDPVPEVVLAEHGLIDLDTALRNIHRPTSAELLQHAQARLRYDEALAMQLVLARRRAYARQFPAEPCPRIDGGLLDAFDAALPFTLTAGQRDVGEVIAGDLSTIHPMNRLLQGEVGSGKTVVALRAMLQVIDSGRQAALLAPTEVLAAQHARSLRSILGPLGAGGELGAPPEAITVALLTGSTPTSVRRRALLDIASGQPGIVVGTHALLSEDVIFPNLGLVVVDEQHRFGVEQRDALRTKHPGSNPPHVLVMTATPIPRTVAMTVFGDLDVSTLSELPVGRAGVSTTVVPAREKPAWLDRVWQRVREEVAAGHQAYVVCPKIGDDGGAEDQDLEPDDGGDEDAKRPPLAVLDVAEGLRTGPLDGLRLGVLHGRLPPGEKDTVMRAFAAGQLDVLVATTVIEVGVDVPNASVMVIMDAERFGMSQLHQLRGRVGRGSVPGVCLLVTEAEGSSPGRARLAAVAATEDGFLLAEADLSLRREGDVLGAAQSGRSTSLRQLSLLRDREVIERARADAVAMVADDPEMAGLPHLAAMADAIIDTESQDYLQKG
jgi:ATP-dependent DNA helicase RecG